MVILTIQVMTLFGQRFSVVTHPHPGTPGRFFGHAGGNYPVSRARARYKFASPSATQLRLAFLSALAHLGKASQPLYHREHVLHPRTDLRLVAVPAALALVHLTTLAYPLVGEATC